MQDRIEAEFLFQTPSETAYAVADATGMDTDVLWKTARKTLNKAREAFEGNEPEGSWVRIASELLEGVFEALDPHAMLRVMDV